MSDQTDIVTRQLIRFGLDSDEARIYLLLLSKTSLSALEISKYLHIARTRVYRLLDKMSVRGLVTQKYDSPGLKFSASSPRQLELLVKEKEAEAESLRSVLPTMVEQLNGLPGVADRGSKVFYHSGIDGLKHVTWNSLSAKGLLRIYEVSENMDAFINPKLSERIREEFAERNIHVRQLTNSTHIQSHTKVKKLVRKLWTVRHIDPKQFPIKSEILLYNDTYTMYHYQNNDIFCIEIINPDVVRMQERMFDFIWEKATEMKILNDQGEAGIEDRKLRIDDRVKR